MAHHFKFTVSVTVERTSGKFAPVEEIEAALTTGIDDGLSSASLDGLDQDGTSEYTIADYDIHGGRVSR